MNIFLRTGRRVFFELANGSMESWPTLSQRLQAQHP